MVDTTKQLIDLDTTTVSDTVIHYQCDYRARCEKCDGTGYQQRNDGVYVICPICKGTGRMDRMAECPEPWYPPCHTYPMPWRDLPTYTEPRSRYVITCQ